MVKQRVQIRDGQQSGCRQDQHDQTDYASERRANAAGAKASPGCGEKQDWQQICREPNELKERRGNVGADRPGEVVRFCLTRRIPGRVVRIEGRRHQTQREQQADRQQENRDDLIQARVARRYDSGFALDLCTGHQRLQRQCQSIVLGGLF